MNIPIQHKPIGEVSLVVANPADKHLMAIALEVAKLSGWALADLHLPGRWASVCWPRQVCMYIQHRCSLASYRDIGRFWHRDHNTITYSCRVVENRMTVDPQVRRWLDGLVTKLIQAGIVPNNPLFVPHQTKNERPT